MADLLTLSEYKEKSGTPAGDFDPSDDAALVSAIEAMTTAIRNYVGRDFAAPVVTQARDYRYDQSGYLDIDDASAITLLEFVDIAGVYPLIAQEWSAEPFGQPVFTYIQLPAYAGGSPEMGFARNWDVMAREGRFPRYGDKVRVTATWGWTSVPDDIKQAAYWTVQSFRQDAQTSQSESIAGYSRSSGGNTPEAIPKTAQQLLEQYRRVNV